MPKHGTAPIFAKAAKLHGFEKVLYLALGEVDEDAAGYVQLIKDAQRCKIGWRAKNPYSGPDAEEKLQALLASLDPELAEARAWLDAEVLKNESDTFRKIADVLDRDRANAERTTQTPFGPWFWANASEPLATDIAYWECETPHGGTFHDLWTHLNRVERHKRQWARLNATQLEAAQRVVRRTARAIGTRLAPDAKGPRKE